MWCPGSRGSCSLLCPLGVLCCVCGVLGHLTPVHRCACSCVALRVQCPGPLGSCSQMSPLGVLCCVCAVLGHLAPVHRCARSVRCFACAVSWATWLLVSSVPARCVALRVRCPGPLGSCSPVRLLGALLSWCGVLGHLAPVYRCARSVCCVACAVSLATWLLFTGVPVRCLAWGVRCPGPRGSRSPECRCGLFCCVGGVLGHLARVDWCAGSVCCDAQAASWAAWLLFIGVPARFGVLRVRCPGPLGFCSPVCPLRPLLSLCGVPPHLAPVHQCASSFCCVACAVVLAIWLLFTGWPARCVVLRVPCPGPLGSCPPVCPLHPLLCLCGVLGYLTPVHRCACSVCCVACAVSWATWLVFTSVPVLGVVLCVRCPGPLGFCSPVCFLGVLCCG